MYDDNTHTLLQPTGKIVFYSSPPPPLSYYIYCITNMSSGRPALGPDPGTLPIIVKILTR